MSLTRTRKAALILAVAALSLPSPVSAQYPVPGDDPTHPRLMFPDSSITLNDQCPVRHGALSPNYRPTYVNSRPIGFC